MSKTRRPGRARCILSAMMGRNPVNPIRWLFDSRHGPQGRLVPRWLFLRALAAIYFSAFYSLLVQIKGLIGPHGILPAQRLSHGCCAAARLVALLVCALPLLDLVERRGADDRHLDRPHCFGRRLLQSLAAPQLLSLLDLLPLVCRRIQHLLQLSIRRHVARSRNYRVVLCAARLAARLGRGTSTLAREPVAAAVGVVSHLL